ncbi:glutathione S-transferase N-terminal domain-containing protein [Terasakiella sp. A23]|uniref:glutathione S-transferase N-terminal domain-containing protein n=1 Tax=Terasakiella sp. FCG-A23 TaxID=3080561 RepID=UPI00295468C0|nr:glutathione S-transferase N-terminal domain-containing protein [Terasakiella sp. A23]MDV7339513.1 glutathione S-transferase N-terminal domain-containing protein [Terasakiella sp. A23]
MKLCYSPTSPYVRKVMVSAHELGLIDRIELVATNVWDPETDIGLTNPLGKVPALTLDDGHVVYDSPVICEYLDELVPSVVLFPAPGKARWKALHFQALGDGITDAGILRLLEGRRDSAEQSAKWIARQTTVMNRGLDALEKEIDELSGGPLTIGQISVACSLDWILFRKLEDDLFAGRPRLKAWFEAFAERPSMKVTEPKE